MAPPKEKVEIDNTFVVGGKKLKYSQSQIYNHIGMY